MQRATLDEVRTALEALPPDLDWPSVRDRVIPMFERSRPYPSGHPEPLRAIVPPGVSIGFAIDIGPAFANVSREMLEAWKVAPAELTACALANVRQRAAGMTMGQVFRGSVGGGMLASLQSGTGSASTFVLVPDVLGRLLGSAPRLLLAPMRDLLVSLPINVERGFAAWLFDEFAALDPNCLAPAAFHFRDGSIAVEPLGPAFGVA
jgi:hypothetical protein